MTRGVTLIKKWKFLVLAIVFLLILIIFYYPTGNSENINIIKCFLQLHHIEREPSATMITDSRKLKPLEDVLYAEPKPPSGRSIFFLETSRCMEWNKLELTARQACAIESAALHNPNLKVFLLFGSPTYYQMNGSRRTEQPVIDAILSYPNVEIRQLNVMQYMTDTPIRNWSIHHYLSGSSYPVNHLSDLLRLLTLYRYGGIYLDLDIVLLRSLENVPLNFVGAESRDSLANGVLSLDSTGFGHDLATAFLRDFVEKYDGLEWGKNGPGVITRVIKNICGHQHSENGFQNGLNCKGFRIFDRKAFYAVHWTNWRYFFDTDRLQETLDLAKDSYLVHVWNKHSSSVPIKVGSSTAYGRIASEHCPKAYAASGDYF